ncbi:hypothetical protein AMAG_11773 [Allomyces macrogynus ATCC 38327]|uniref:Uncharacterized protein n=1 Tax=Allomyces macrogynus (strain ATCC 38327) TaxID=578462 RepID=A0A0L0SWE3_ALLM3|nr:hypothetical protein AMAG_11773 [Allomyces macrogynus ATCC 38327]|eukprot:KNE66659.1 hypothetical protein AMAG_11773 [Allomyces macrogynus ATCC 38327]
MSDTNSNDDLSRMDVGTGSDEELEGEEEGQQGGADAVDHEEETEMTTAIMAGIKLLPDLLSHQKSVDSTVLEAAEQRMEIAEQKVSIAAAVEEAENENRSPNMDAKIRQLRQIHHDLQTHLRNTKHEYSQGVIEYRNVIKKALPRGSRQNVLTMLANIQQEMAGIKGSIAALTSDVATVKVGITALQRQQVGTQIMAWICSRISKT